MGRIEYHNLPDITNQIHYLPDSRIQLLEKGINLILEAVSADSDIQS